MRRAGVDVVVPSHRRPVALGRCLAGLAAQERAPDRVVVVARADDAPTLDVVADATRDLPVVAVTVTPPGLVPALAAGVAATIQPRVAFTDDDAVPHPGWLAGLTALLDEPGVGVAGGRDLVPGELEPGRRNVGTLARWGRFTGDHHLGRGPARDVHVVKGVNMAFRAEALAVPRPGVLQGAGTAVHNEQLMCAWARARGWRVRYDPSITVDHRTLRDELFGDAPDPRASESGRVAGAHNRMLGTLATDPDRAAVHVAYAFLVGCREAPGVARAAWALAHGDVDVARTMRPALAGAWSALRDVRVLDDAMRPCLELRCRRSACA
jgi:hypothetical protein